MTIFQSINEKKMDKVILALCQNQI